MRVSLVLHRSCVSAIVAAGTAVDSAVANDLAARVNAGDQISEAGDGFSTFRTNVEGWTIEYRGVFVPQTGVYEVGTYYIP